MKKIYGDPQVIEKARQATPGNKSVYINFDAINELPDEYEVIITEIKFDPKNLPVDFSNVGSKDNPSWMPTPALMYRIAEAKGIKGGENSTSEPIVETVDINPMLCKTAIDEPTMRTIIVGRKVSKYSVVMEEDGTERRSSICTVNYNVFERCCEAWKKEELYTEGYTKQNKYTNKYDNQWKRQHHFQEEMKFAHAKAETKAHEKTIRELAGLQTGYKTAELEQGCLIFSKVRRSREVLRMETAARLSAISQGFKQEKQLLFNEDTVQKSYPVDNTPITKKSDKEMMIEALCFYKIENLLPEKIKPSIDALLQWLENTENPQSDDRFWGRALTVLKEIEYSLPEQARFKHNIRGVL